MDAEAAKYIGAGLAVLPLLGVGLGGSAVDRLHGALVFGNLRVHLATERVRVLERQVR